MTNRRKKIDNKQRAFDFEARIEAYQAAREEVLKACREPGSTRKPHNTADEACIEIAAALKRMVRESDFSREQLVDEVNAYFGLDLSMSGGEENPDEFGFSRKPLTIHMLNHYLSKPVQYPIPAYYIFALQFITGSLEVTKVLAELLGARIISGAEVRQMTLGRLDEMITELLQLKRELKGAKP